MKVFTSLTVVAIVARAAGSFAAELRGNGMMQHSYDDLIPDSYKRYLAPYHPPKKHRVLSEESASADDSDSTDASSLDDRDFCQNRVCARRGKFFASSGDFVEGRTMADCLQFCQNAEYSSLTLDADGNPQLNVAPPGSIDVEKDVFVQRFESIPDNFPFPPPPGRKFPLGSLCFCTVGCEAPEIAEPGLGIDIDVLTPQHVECEDIDFVLPSVMP